MTYDRRAAEETSPAEDVGEIEVAEWIILILAFDTYYRTLKEKTGVRDPIDPVIQKGLGLVRQANSQNGDAFHAFLTEHMPTPSLKTMLAKAFRLGTSRAGLPRQALQIRMVLDRGGLVRKVFKTNRAVNEVKTAISASQYDDGAAALDKFAVINIRNGRIRGWIDLASKTAGSGSFQNAVDAASTAVQEETAAVALDHQKKEAAPLVSEEAHASAQSKSDRLIAIQQTATEVAQKSLDISGEADVPPKKSEVIGIATAAAVAAVASQDSSVPETIRKLDPEQREAALTDGRVGVFAGAGSGKSTTLVARVAYLVKDRHVNPSRILVTSFNTKAAAELKEKIGRAAGGDALQQMSVGTMHSLFRRFIMDFGTTEEKASLNAGFVEGGNSVAYAVQKIWEDCNKGTPPPKLKMAMMEKSKWSGNDISPEMAKAQAQTKDEIDAARWYEMYEGLKGTSGNWKPPCASKAYENFMGRYRSKVNRLGDFTDMLKIYRDILKRNPAVRAKVQGMFDHIIVDEAQDRNKLMSDIIDMMSEHITDGADGKSVWIVGDDKQAINSFQGAKSQLFKDIYQKEGWKTRVIRTNYRCEPEIVDAANKLIAHNDGNVPVPQVAAPGRKQGIGSVKVEVPQDEADAALSVIEEIKQNHVLGGDFTDNAVLSRTNKELHAYETACIIRGVPYARRGASSFLGSPETKAVLGYVQLVTGVDYSKMQAALGQVINNPNRFFLSDPKKAPEAIEQVFTSYARTTGSDVKNINPLTALRDPAFVRLLAASLAKLTRTGKGFRFEEKIQDLSAGLDEMKAKSGDPKYETKALFDDILGLEGTTIEAGVFKPQTFRESLKASLRDAMGGEEPDEDEDEEDETKGLGNVSFLYKLAEQDPTDEGDAMTPPTTPQGFAAKMTRYAAKMRDLRTDTDKWYKEQATLPPEQRRPPPGVYLGTVHSTKGAQWKTTFVQMPKGKFPMEFKPRPGELPPDPEKEHERWEDERRLGYVALTRAAQNLRVVCPRVVGGKSCGVSSFVTEAGLKPGENVVKTGSEFTSAEESPPTEPILQEATPPDLYDDDLSAYASPVEPVQGGSYDRRTT